MKDEEIRMVAKVAHEANRAYCETLNDFSQPPWWGIPDWQEESIMNGVRFRLENPDITPEQQHKQWMKQKTEEGWVYGETKDPEKKTHPCLVDYEDLPEVQKFKDSLFGVIVDVFRKDYLSRLDYNNRKI